MFLAQNHLQLIIEFALVIHVGVILFFNVISVSLSMVLFLGIILTVFLAILFGVDATLLFLPYVSHHEFTHPFGPIAVLAWVTVTAAANLLGEVGIRSTSIKALSIILFVVIAVAGSLMHRSFLLLWLLGWGMGMLIMSKSFKRTSKITMGKILSLTALGLGAFGIMEAISKIFNAPVLSPLLRVSRIEEFSIPSLKMVVKNAVLWGHVQGTCYWGSGCLGGSDGYISLPMSLIHFLTLPFPLFNGVLVTKKDYIDYILPGIFGITFDFGFAFLFLILAWSVMVIGTGFMVLRKYRSKRREGSRMYLGREAILIGSLSAFIAQSIVGLFIFNRTINGAAMITFIVLSALVLAHVVTLRRKV